MGRRERRQLQKAKTKHNKSHLSDWETAPWYGKVLLLAVPLFFIVGSLYAALHNSDITDEDLTYQRVTLKEAPIYSGGKHPSIDIKTKEFSTPLTIAGIAYKSSYREGILNQLNANESITVRILKDDADELNEASFFNSSICIYGLQKDGNTYIDLDLRNKLQKEDNQWAYFGVGFGLIMAFYIFAKYQPKLEMDDALGIYSGIFLAILLVLYFFKKYMS